MLQITGQSSEGQKQYSKASTRQYYRAPQKQNNQFTCKYMPKINKLAVSSSSEDEYTYVIGNVYGEVQHPRSAVTVNGQCVELLIDSGLNVNLLDKFTFDRIGTNLILRAVTKKIHSYEFNVPLPVLGKVTADVVSGKKLISATFYIVEGSHGCLLGYDTCTELGLLHITNAVSSTLVENHIASQYSELFEDLGNVTGTKIKLYTDTEVTPTAQSHRRIPFHMRRKVEEIVRLEKAHDKSRTVVFEKFKEKGRTLNKFNKGTLEFLGHIFSGNGVSPDPKRVQDIKRAELPKYHSQVIAYVSRALTDVKSRYSQTEREALAVTKGCLHFRLYIYGRPFTIVTEHNPLVSILGNPNSKSPLRVERWALKLQQYEYNIVYQTGETNLADYMSRHPTSECDITGREAKMANEYVNFTVVNSVCKNHHSG